MRSVFDFTSEKENDKKNWKTWASLCYWIGKRSFINSFYQEGAKLWNLLSNSMLKVVGQKSSHPILASCRSWKNPYIKTGQTLSVLFIIPSCFLKKLPLNIWQLNVKATEFRRPKRNIAAVADLRIHDAI